MVTYEVFITGEGEPFLNPCLFDIIAFLKKEDIITHLNTNGTLFNDTNAADLLDSGLDALKISFWASSTKEYAQCYPGAKPDNFLKTVEGIKKVTRLKAERKAVLPKVILTGPINLYNYKTIDERIKLANELGCDGVAFAPYKHWRGEFASAVLPAAEFISLRKNLVQVKKLCKSLSLEHNIDNLLWQYAMGEKAWTKIPCSAGWYYTRIRSDGTVLPCCRCYYPLGDLTVQSFNEIWNGEKYRSFRAKSRMKNGLVSLSRYCDCNWCIMVKNNYMIHRYSRWVFPFLGRKV